MRKYIALALALMLCLSGCTKPPEPTSVPTTTVPEVTTIPTTVPETTQPQLELPHLPLTSVTTTITTEAAPDGARFEYSYPNIHLLLTDPAITDKVSLELMNRIDSTRAAAEDVMGSAGNDELYFYTVRYDPVRVDSGVLSLFGSQTSYAGGMHPYTECVSVTYDLTTGNALLLTDVLTSGCTAADLSPLVLDALTELAEDVYLYSDYPSVVEERFGQDLSNDFGWYLSNEGLCFYFSPYEVAPYATGTVTAVVPYEKLTGVLRDAYFPVEKSGATGAVDAVLFGQTDPTQFEQFAEVIIDREGEAVLLHTEGLVFDVTIEYGQWNGEGTVFTPTVTVFAASNLTPYDGVLLQAYFPDVMPNLRLTYTTAEGVVQKYIFQSGKDGSILLVD